MTASNSKKDKWETLASTALIDVMTTPVVIADKDYYIRYANPAAVAAFTALEPRLRKDLPQFSAKTLIGKNVDVFHKDPSHQRRILDNMAKPHNGVIDFAEVMLTFTAAPLFDENGDMDAVIVELADGTEQRDAQKLNDVVSSQFQTLLKQMEIMSMAHEAGDIDVMIDVSSFKLEDLRAAAVMVNDMVQAHIDTKKAAMAVVEKFGDGNFDADLPQLPGKKIFLNNIINKVRANFRSVTSEVTRLSDSIVNGNLDVTVNTEKFSGEYAQIVESFERAFLSLNNAFSVISDQVDQVGQTVDQMSNASQSLSANSQIASSSVDEVSASAEETDQQVKANAEAAQNASRYVGSAVEFASEGAGKVREMVGAMDGIKTSSQDIAKIIKVIDEIAFQTNLLALNAAVEAARAGQHGRGFAVVAQEVRNLAGRSAKAARETSDLIEDASNRVNSGVRIADETSNAFTKITTEIQQVKSIVEDIDRASEEQARGVAQISQAIADIAKTTLSTSQQADELATTSAQMNSAAQQMTAEIRRFKLKRMADGGQSFMTADQLTPEMMAQLQRMMGGMKNGAKPAKSSPSVDQDARGYGPF
ncbi:methyl-accepting chemotaxis protein [Pseudoprimorskyibacter insulae]|nr:methyl-accepting chemotaxis protein [Pseudoprimorskyibacter insulae]